MKFLIFIIVLIWANTLSGQGLRRFLMSDERQDTNLLILSVENTNFLYDSEYSNVFVRGKTLPGFFIKPQIHWQAFDKIRFSGGLFWQSYFGERETAQFTPVFSIDWKINSKLNFKFGDINGTVNHNLPEAVFDPEIYLTKNIENGFQILYKTDRLNSDTWLDWEQFIYEDSDFPEILTAGSSNILQLFPAENPISLNLKFAGIATHIGGQIDGRGTDVQTFVNLLTGFDLSKQIDNQYVKNMDIYADYIIATDASPEKKMLYLYGYGILSGLELTNDFLEINLEHWYGNMYFSRKGNGMLQSVSQIYTHYKENERAFIMTKFFIHKDINTAFKIGAGANTYYDLYHQDLDFSFGFYIRTNFNYILKK